MQTHISAIVPTSSNVDHSAKKYYFLPYLTKTLVSTWPRLAYRQDCWARHCFSSILLHYVMHVVDIHSRGLCVSKRRVSTACFNEETWGIESETDTRVARRLTREESRSSSPAPLLRLSDFNVGSFSEMGCSRMYPIGRRPPLRNPLSGFSVDSLDLLSGNGESRHSWEIFRENFPIAVHRWTAWKNDPR